jgi:hypothetical protein
VDSQELLVATRQAHGRSGPTQRAAHTEAEEAEEEEEKEEERRSSSIAAGAAAIGDAATYPLGGGLVGAVGARRAHGS